MKWLVLVVVWIGLAGAVMSTSAARAAQAPAVGPSSPWDGVYSAPQAARGKTEFESHCRSCHGDDLGGGDGPALVGESFLRNWFEDNLDNLFTKIQMRMPADVPNSLDARVYADLLAFLLQANGFPAGEREMTPDHTALARIQIVGKNGPRPVPDSSLVQIVGCLNSGSDNDWVVDKGTEPARTRDPGPSSSAEMDAWGSKPLGTHTFRLLDAGAFALDGYKNRKVVVKGFLLRRPDGSRLNTTWVGPLAASCSQE